MQPAGAADRPKVNNFDLLRIFAATQVMIGHGIAHLGIAAPAWLLDLVHAFPGVPIFFVISGFLISASWERSEGLVAYARNRALRIFPALWCCVLATVLVTGAFGFSTLHRDGVAWFGAQLAGLIYTPEFLAGFGMGSYNGSLWTIPIELQFYVMLPVVYALLALRPGKGTARLALAWLAFVGIGVAAHGLADSYAGAEPLAYKLLRYSFVPQFFLFLAGVLMQRCRIHESRLMAGKGAWWLAAYLGFHYAAPASPATYVPSTLLLGVAAVSMAFTAPTTARRWLRGNDISYGVYIYHGLLINAFLEMGLAGTPWLLAWLVACALMVGYLSWVLVERPFLRRKRRHGPSGSWTAWPGVAGAARTADKVPATSGIASGEIS
jgi:peptidoglycan/LPS O-acetylase OafA/YrhL